MARTILLIAGISGALAVALGAMGAHALKNHLDAYAMDVYVKAATYHFYHSFALLGIGLLAIHAPSRALRVSTIAMVIGIVLFSGSLYALAITGIRTFGMITPFGGIAFIIGWLGIAKAAWGMRDKP